MGHHLQLTKTLSLGLFKGVDTNHEEGMFKKINHMFTGRFANKIANGTISHNLFYNFELGARFLNIILHIITPKKRVAFATPRKYTVSVIIP